MSFDDLEIGDYQRVLENPARWAKLRWPLDRATFIRRLDELRVIRNNVMHFNPEPVPADAVDKLRYILKLLRDFGGLITRSRAVVRLTLCRRARETRPEMIRQGISGALGSRPYGACAASGRARTVVDAPSL
jgi:hypothetical protein